MEWNRMEQNRTEQNRIQWNGIEQKRVHKPALAILVIFLLLIAVNTIEQIFGSFKKVYK